jgi:hypothetical protein
MVIAAGFEKVVLEPQGVADGVGVTPGVGLTPGVGDAQPPVMSDTSSIT